MGRRLAALLLAAVLLLTAGCNGGRETDEVAYVIAMGIDAAPGGRLKVTYRIAKPGALAGESVVDKETSVLVTITAESLAIARDRMNTAVARTMNISHVKAILIGEELARRGVDDIISPTMRFREYRGSMFIHVAVGATAEAVLRANKPSIETVGSRYVEAHMATAPWTGAYPAAFLHEFYSRLKGGTGSPFATAVTINPVDDTPRPLTAAAPPDKAAEYLGSGVGREGGNPVSFGGTAVFRRDKMVGVLSDEETRAFMLLLGELNRSFVTVEDPLVPKKGVNIWLRPGGPVRVDIELPDGRAAIRIEVPLEGEITAIPSGIRYEGDQYRQLLEEQVSIAIKADIDKMITRTQAMGADVADLGKHIRPKFRTYAEFRKYDWDSVYPQAEVTVKVTTRLRRSGLMWKTSPIRGGE